MSNEMKKVDFKLTREGLVKIEHKASKGSAEVLPESVPTWLESGWTVADPASGEAEYVVVVDEDKNTGTVTPVKEK